MLYGTLGLGGFLVGKGIGDLMWDHRHDNPLNPKIGRLIPLKPGQKGYVSSQKFQTMPLASNPSASQPRYITGGGVSEYSKTRVFS